MSQLIDVMFGVAGAAIAWTVYQMTEQPIWALLLLAAYTVVFWWLRNRGAN